MIKIIEYVGSLAAIMGALLLALNYDFVGYIFFIISGFFLMPQAFLSKLNGLLAMQTVFFIINIIGLLNRWHA